MRIFYFNISLILVFLGSITLGFAEEKKQKLGLENELRTTLNLAQGSFTNWAKGGENSITWRSDLMGKVVIDKKNYRWAINTNLSFGKTKISDNGFRKSADELKMETVYSFKKEIHVNPYIAFSALTQFAPGYKYHDKDKRIQTSDFMDPGYLTQSLGFGYSPFKQLKTRMGFAVKETLTKKFPKPFADNPKTDRVEKIKVEKGLDATVDFDQKLNSTLRYTSKVVLFSDLSRFDEIDVNWDNLFMAKITNIIQVNLVVKLVYDSNFSRKSQLMQSLAAGFVFDLI